MKALVILILVLSSSCSSLKKTVVYSALAGGMTGAVAGTFLSPDKQSKGANAAIFGLIGAGVAALTGYVLYQDDPRNYTLKNMLLDPDKKEPANPNEIELGLGPLKIDANLEKQEAYQVPVKELPEQLKGKVNKQYLIKYQSKERYVKKGAKTFYIPAFDVYEHAYGDRANSEEELINEQ
jgi:hypothetical protein